MPKKKSEHYVNNKEFYEALVVYKEKVRNAEKNDLPKPRISNYIGQCFLKIATQYSYKPNFVNYMYREDMISDGIENCVQYIHNFNPDKYKNPFAYFTQIIHFAFLRRIHREKREMDKKNKLIEKADYKQVMTIDEGHLSASNSDYNTIKDNIQHRNNR
jgi:hypothetical protein